MKNATNLDKTATFCRQCRQLLALSLLSSSTLLVTPLFAKNINVHWSADGQRLWFQTEAEEGVKRFKILDVASGMVTPAFDSKIVNRKLEALNSETPLSVDRIAFAEPVAGDAPETGDQIVLACGDRYFSLDLKTYELESTVQPDALRKNLRLFLPPGRSRSSEEETHIFVRNDTKFELELFWIDPAGREVGYGHIKPGEERKQHTFVRHAWLFKSATGKRLACFEAAGDDRLIIDEESLANTTHRSQGHEDHQEAMLRDDEWLFRQSDIDSPNGKWQLTVRGDDLWLGRLPSSAGSASQLAQPSDAEFTFRNISDGRFICDDENAAAKGPDVRWAPNAKHFVAFETKMVVEPRVHYVESAPEDQLQPKLQSYQYPKPGADLPVKKLRLFAIDDEHEIAVSNELFSNPYELEFLGWSKSGDKCWLRYNQRGHQVMRLLEVAAADGAVRTIVSETSDTFVHYSDPGKSELDFLPENRLLWASERTGWNHLYLYDLIDGDLMNAVTTGEWNVKRVEKIDRDNEVVWFYAVGVYPDQDPYHEHFCRANSDGSDFAILTEGDGTHTIRFEQDGQYFLDTHSRIDLAPVTELRDSESGALVAALDRKDAGTEFGNRPLTTRFAAKGRDGETDVWGIIHWPSDFDLEQSYPVVENIYAGPHDQHVPKAFRQHFRHQHEIADAGMIVVQIDGMGTAWRSKRFHDVCHKNLRDAGFPDRIAWMKAAAKKFPQMDLSRVGIYGGSAGGQNAMAALLWHNDVYKVSVADCGCHDNRMDKLWWNEQWMGWPVDESYVENSNVENAHRMKGHLMLTLGELDRNVDPASTTQVVRKLIEHDKDFEFVLVAGHGHGAGESPWARKKRLAFLKRHLPVE